MKLSSKFGGLYDEDEFVIRKNVSIVGFILYTILLIIIYIYGFSDEMPTSVKVIIIGILSLGLLFPGNIIKEYYFGF
jgi:hypothetical protein